MDGWMGMRILFHLSVERSIAIFFLFLLLLQPGLEGINVCVYALYSFSLYLSLSACNSEYLLRCG